MDGYADILTLLAEQFPALFIELGLHVEERDHGERCRGDHSTNDKEQENSSCYLGAKGFEFQFHMHISDIRIRPSTCHCGFRGSR